MDARAYEVARITGIGTPSSKADHPGASDLDPARGFVLAIGISVGFWTLLIAGLVKALI